VRLTFLGSGDAFCDWRVNYHNNAVVETAAGLVLLDCGMTALQSMRELGLGAHDLAAVLVTHVHADHASLAPLLLERFFVGPQGPTWRSTRICAPADVLVDVKGVLAPYFDGMNGPEGGHQGGGLAGVLEAEEAHEIEVGGVHFRYFQVPHVRDGVWDKPAYGVELRVGPRRTVWSADTVFRRDWIEETAADPDLVSFFHDCTFSPRFPDTVHTHFEELERLPAAVKARITLMHHVAVPEGVDISAFAGAAERHQRFEL